MQKDSRPGIAIVTRSTRMQGMLQRWSTRGAARFALVAARRALVQDTSSATLKAAEQLAEADFDELRSEDEEYHRAVQTLHAQLDFGVPVQMVDRSFLPNFDFGRFEVVVVVGQDGLVANAAKYVGTVPIVAINPDPKRFDGVLLPFRLQDARKGVERVLQSRFRERAVTLAEVRLQDGQRMLAFNDLFVGAATHVSARYTLRLASGAETQSSSGMIISTGAGSTGWFSSVINMASGVAAALGGKTTPRPSLSWEERALLWTVREPFVSRTSQAGLVFGRLDFGARMIVESNMPAGGVIFSDGVESDFLEFNNGAIATIGVADQQARLVVP